MQLCRERLVASSTTYRDAVASRPTFVASSAASMISVISTTASSCPFIPMPWSEMGVFR